MATPRQDFSQIHGETSHKFTARLLTNPYRDLSQIHIETSHAAGNWPSTARRRRLCGGGQDSDRLQVMRLTGSHTETRSESYREPYKDSQGAIQRLTVSHTMTHWESQDQLQRLTVSHRDSHTEMTQRLTMRLTQIFTKPHR